ncbi:DUF2974 domain-containing protein [Mesobacillus maritimus]|uniref:Mbeg1-like protein n=1 Tax=Mesobacillus maritimus TaxID=1643336 RepID=UPI0020407BCE|nr:Mbeg1-like protein [Mesobacillus maritimus]MCM3585270.1 DUF2974 domain-containing protein [Mesobacillus maritimus]
MSLTDLTEQEKNLLLQLSYLDLPPETKVNGKKPISFEDTIATIDVDTLPGDAKDRYQAISNYLTHSPNSALKDLQLVGYRNHNPNAGNTTGGTAESGFVGYAFKDSQGNGAAIYRGSENPGDSAHLKTDWLSNFQAGLGMEIEQQLEANQFYQDFIQGLEGDQLVFGHSKGGNLAAYVLVHNYQENSELQSYIINGAPLAWWMLEDEQREILKGDRNTFIVYEGDIVHQLGYAPYVDKSVKLTENDYDDPFYPHYETSVTFGENGDFVGAYDGKKWYSDIADFGSIIGMFAGGLVGKARDWVSEQIAAIRNATLSVIHSTVRGLTAAANAVINSVVGFVESVRQVTGQAIQGLRNYFDHVVTNTRLMFSSFIGSITGNNFSVEPYLKVDVQRLAYYSSRLQTIKRKTDQLNRRIDELYLEVGLRGIDNVFRADMLTTFDWQIKQNIDYLNKTAALVERAESLLVGKARSIT